MKMSLYCIGRTEYAPYREAISRYTGRIVHYLPFDLKEIPDIKNTRNLSEAQQKSLEGESILASLAPNDFLVLLDEHGREYTSRDFAAFISSKMLTLPTRLVFAIGGPYGFSESVYRRANAKISLSKMTFPHDLVRVLLVEQIYRAMTIMRGEPYHHD